MRQTRRPNIASRSFFGFSAVSSRHHITDAKITAPKSSPSLTTLDVSLQWISAATGAAAEGLAHLLALASRARILLSYNSRAEGSLPYDLRRFAANTLAVEAEWANGVFYQGAWTETGQRFCTHTGPVQVRHASGLLALKKPGPNGPFEPLFAVREKIVSDLAFALGLPVPPVTLLEAGTDRDRKVYAVSAWAFEQSLTWAQASTHIGGIQAAALVPAMSAMMPFESWISAQDRQNSGNVLVSMEPDGTPVAAWIDYVFSLDASWGGNQNPHCSIVAGYPPFGAPDQALIFEVAERIAAMENGVIEQIVNKIPAPWLSRASAEAICGNLLARRAGVAATWLGS